MDGKSYVINQTRNYILGKDNIKHPDPWLRARLGKEKSKIQLHHVARVAPANQKSEPARHEAV